MKLNKLYLTLAAGALSIVPVFAADATTSATPAKPQAEAAKPQAEAAKPAAKRATAVVAAKPVAPKVDIWKDLPDVVATVDGKPVTKAELVASIKAQLPNGEIPAQITPDMVAEAAPGMTEAMIEDRLVEAEFKANKPNLTREQAKEFMLREFKSLPKQQLAMMNQMLAAKKMTPEEFVDKQLDQPGTIDQLEKLAFAKKVIFKGCEVTEEEAKKFYDEHAAEFPEVVGASHILVQVKPDADEAAKKAALDKINRIAEEVKKNPAAFEEIAKKESDCPSKAQGGKLGEFPRRQMDPEFEKAAFALKQGEISGVVKSRFGYHIIRCDAAAKRVSFDMVRDDLRQILLQPKLEKAQRAYMDALKKRHNVQILVKAPAPAPAPAAAPAAPAAK